MKLKKLAAGLGALGLLAVAAPSFADPILTFNDGRRARTVGRSVWRHSTYISNAIGGLDGCPVSTASP